MRQVLRAGALGRPRGMGWGGRWEGGLGRGTHVNPWLIHVNKYYFKKTEMLNLICLEFTRQAMCSFHTINPQLQKYSFF